MINTHLKVFDTEANYEAGKLNLDMPNVSYCEDTEKLKYLNSKMDLYDIYGTMNTNSWNTVKFTINGSDYTVTATGEDNHFGIVFSQPVTSFTADYKRGSIVTFDKFAVDTSEMTNMQSMFNGYSKLTSINLSKVDTRKATNMSRMFMSCNALTALDVSNFDTSLVTDMSYMFGQLDSITSLDVSNFNTSAVTTMNSMFYPCKNLTALDLSNFDTSNVTDTSIMFAYCNKLATLNISNWDMSNVSSSMQMFNSIGKDVPSITITMNNTNTTTFDMIKAQLVTDNVASKVTIIRDGVSYKYQNGAWVAK